MGGPNCYCMKAFIKFSVAVFPSQFNIEMYSPYVFLLHSFKKYFILITVRPSEIGGMDYAYIMISPLFYDELRDISQWRNENGNQHNDHI